MNKLALRYILAIILLSIILASCKQKKDIVLNNADILHNNQDELTQLIIYDVFSPPVAARIYAYTSLASYKAVRYMQPGSPSLVEQMHGFGKMPVPDTSKKYNYVLAATEAFFTVAKKVTFSIDSLKAYNKDFISLKKREGFFKRLGGTLGYNIKDSTLK